MQTWHVWLIVGLWAVQTLLMGVGVWTVLYIRREQDRRIAQLERTLGEERETKRLLREQIKILNREPGAFIVDPDFFEPPT